MHKIEKTGGKFFLQWETHSRHLTKGLCMLMERQGMVDIAICCGNNTMHAHKCVLAANSTYFKEHFENKAIEQVVINGIDFSVMKAVIEFMYSGECVVGEDHLKHFIAAVKLFKIASLESIFAENEYQAITADEVVIPPLQFVCKPPKYPTVFKPFNSPTMTPKINYALNNMYTPHKFKRRTLGTEAEKACAKEAQASRIALANLRKVMASTPQVHSFIVEESFNETTVENFIPNAVEDSYEEDIPEGQFSNGVNPGKSGSTPGLTADKIKHILGNDEVEIMFQTSDGNFVNVSDEVLLNLSKGGLQYQVVDEHGHVGELQELKSLETETNSKPDTSLKGEGKNYQQEGKMKTLPEEYFGNSQPQSFNEGFYENAFHNSEIFEPENLSMHSALMTDNTMSFDAVNDLKYKYLASKVHAIRSANEAMSIDNGDSVCFKETADSTNSVTKPEESNKQATKSTENKMKFTPDMFFADLPDECTENNAKPVETISLL